MRKPPLNILQRNQRQSLSQGCREGTHGARFESTQGGLEFSNTAFKRIEIGGVRGQMQDLSPARLGLQYRVIYRSFSKQSLFQVEHVTPRDYRRP